MQVDPSKTFRHFLLSGQMAYGVDDKISKPDLQEAYREYCKRERVPMQSWEEADGSGKMVVRAFEFVERKLSKPNSKVSIYPHDVRGKKIAGIQYYEGLDLAERAESDRGLGNPFSNTRHAAAAASAKRARDEDPAQDRQAAMKFL